MDDFVSSDKQLPPAQMAAAADSEQAVSGISCAGIIFLSMLLIFLVGNIITSGRLDAAAVTQLVRTDTPPPTLTAIASQPALAAVTNAPTRTPELTPTLQPTSPPTQTPTSTPSPTPSSTPTETAVPSNTLIPTPIPTSTPIPLPTPAAGVSLILDIPILMYHYISVPPEDADIYRTDLSITPDNFRQQMQFLADNGYTPIDLYTLSLAITNNAPLPPKPIILTFDDGYLDNYQNAFPILQAFGFTGTFFIITEFVDFQNPNYMSWEMLREMSTAGMRIEPHTKTHRNLRDLDREGQIYQILGSLETVEFHVGYRPRFLAYPGGRYNEETLEIMQELDFWAGLTTGGGVRHQFSNRYELLRVRIRHETSLAAFADLVNPQSYVWTE